jgi:Derlin-2/3
LNFQAQYLCWVLVGFSVLVGQALPYHDLVGLFVGHVYYYFQDVYPRLQASSGRKPLDTPQWLVRLIG